MQIKSDKLGFTLIILSLAFLPGFAQVPYNGFPPAQPAPKPAAAAPKAEAEKKEAVAQPAQEQVPAAAGVNKFDPYMDNFLRAPDPADKLGLFGKPIKEVEGTLREYGAKNYSYAFGKYSRMSLSVYIITMYFDRNRRLAGISVEPRPPYTKIAPDARKFFMDVFLSESSLSRFKALISNEKLELKYNPAGS